VVVLGGFLSWAKFGRTDKKSEIFLLPRKEAQKGVHGGACFGEGATIRRVFQV